MTRQRIERRLSLLEHRARPVDDSRKLRHVPLEQLRVVLEVLEVAMEQGWQPSLNDRLREGAPALADELIARYGSQPPNGSP